MNAMRVSIAALAAAALLSPPLAALAADHEAGVPLTPAEAVGAWTVESGGHSLCVMKLGGEKAGAGFTAQVPATCGDALPSGVTGWAPAAGGMSLIGADGGQLIAFSRWSNSLFVSHRSSGVDVQLKRGGPNP
jgi:Protease inhibitor Inh